MLQVLAVWHVLRLVRPDRADPDALGTRLGLRRDGLHARVPGGTHIVERNLTRLTLVVATVFFVDTIGLYQLLK